MILKSVPAKKNGKFRGKKKKPPPKIVLLKQIIVIMWKSTYNL